MSTRNGNLTPDSKLSAKKGPRTIKNQNDFENLEKLSYVEKP